MPQVDRTGHNSHYDRPELGRAFPFRMEALEKTSLRFEYSNDQDRENVQPHAPPYWQRRIVAP